MTSNITRNPHSLPFSGQHSGRWNPSRRHTNPPGRQSGMSLVGWLLTIALVGGGATLALRLIPHYIDYHTLQSIVEALPVGDVHRMKKSQIRDQLAKRFKINNIRNLDVREILIIERMKTESTLTLDYEVRENIVANVDIVLSFNKSYTFK